MRYFFLSYGEMSLRCLSDLISMNFPPLFVVTHKSYEFENEKDGFYKKLGEICGQTGIELIKTDNILELKEKIKGTQAGVSAGFMEIIKEEIFTIPEYGILNIHCGKLPKYRGRAPISRTIIDGNDTLHLTIHKVDSGVDSGDILYEKEIIIDDEDDVNSLYYKCSFNCAYVLKEAVEKLLNKQKGNFTKQDLSLKPKANLKITNEERCLDWNRNLKDIYNKIRALTYPYPSAFTMLNGVKYHILRSKPLYSLEKPGPNGEITEVNSDFMLVKCKDGFILNYDIRDEKFEKFNYPEIFKKGDILG